MSVGCVLYAQCGACEYLEEHPNRPHSWADPSDIAHYAATGQPDPSSQSCGCPCVNAEKGDNPMTFDLDVLKVQTDRVTPGPWRWGPNPSAPKTVDETGAFVIIVNDDLQSMRDADFMTRARDVVPALIAEVERLRLLVSAGRDETPDEALRVSVLREDLEHILDWHNKRPCGVGQEDYDLRLFKRLAEAVVLSPERAEQLRQEGRDEERAKVQRGMTAVTGGSYGPLGAQGTFIPESRA